MHRKVVFQIERVFCRLTGCDQFHGFMDDFLLHAATADASENAAIGVYDHLGALLSRGRPLCVNNNANGRTFLFIFNFFGF